LLKQNSRLPAECGGHGGGFEKLILLCSLEVSAWSVLSLLAVAIAAEDRSVAIRFEWELSDLGSAIGALPLSLNHLTLTKLVVHA